MRQIALQQFTVQQITLTAVLLFATNCVLALPLHADDKAAAERIDLKLNLKKGDIRNLAFEFRQASKIAGEAPKEFKNQVAHAMRIKVKVEDVDGDGNHALKIDFTQPEFAGNSARMKASPSGELSEISVVADGLGKGKDADSRAATKVGHLGWFFVAPKAPVAVGDAWPLSPDFKYGMTLTFQMGPPKGHKLTANYKLARIANGEATVTLAGEIAHQGKRTGTITGSIVFEAASGWPIDGYIKVDSTRDSKDAPKGPKILSTSTIKIIRPGEQQ